ncbi:hypothetical protein VUR80DRAFT_5185 [Thermomyces stellatus]
MRYKLRKLQPSSPGSAPRRSPTTPEHAILVKLFASILVKAARGPRTTLTRETRLIWRALETLRSLSGICAFGKSLALGTGQSFGGVRRPRTGKPETPPYQHATAPLTCDHWAEASLLSPTAGPKYDLLLPCSPFVSRTCLTELPPNQPTTTLDHHSFAFFYP